jgi:hypothetical protein
VARRIDEDDALTLYMRFIRADVLRNSSSFSTRHIRFADRIEQTGFAVVDVTHHGNNRSSWHFVAGALFFDLLFLHQLFFERNDLHDAAKRFRQTCSGRHIERLVDAGENSAIEQSLQQVFGANIKFLGKFTDRNSFGYR